MGILRLMWVAAFAAFAIVPQAQAQAVSQATADLVNTLQGGDQAAIEQALQGFEALAEEEQAAILLEIGSLDPTLAAQITQQLQAAGLVGAGAGGALTATALAGFAPLAITALIAALAAAGGGGSTPDTQ